MSFSDTHENDFAAHLPTLVMERLISGMHKHGLMIGVDLDFGSFRNALKIIQTKIHRYQLLVDHWALPRVSDSFLEKN